MTVTRSLLGITAGGLALADAMIHAAVLGEHFHKALYMGILFSLALVFLSMLGLGLVSPASADQDAVTGRLLRPLGILLMLGLIAGYLLTRTIGFPGFHGEWEDVGITTVAMEVAIAGLLLVDMAGGLPDTSAQRDEVSVGRSAR